MRHWSGSPSKLRGDGTWGGQHCLTACSVPKHFARSERASCPPRESDRSRSARDRTARDPHSQPARGATKVVGGRTGAALGARTRGSRGSTHTRRPGDRSECPPAYSGPRPPPPVSVEADDPAPRFFAPGADTEPAE